MLVSSLNYLKGPQIKSEIMKFLRDYSPTPFISGALFFPEK
jgi:hypothetical protein